MIATFTLMIWWTIAFKAFSTEAYIVRLFSMVIKNFMFIVLLFVGKQGKYH